MERYRNLSGSSGVTSFEIGPDLIIVQFQNDSRYMYDYIKPGRNHVQQMMVLAQRGRGLATYINKYVRRSCTRIG